MSSSCYLIGYINTETLKLERVKLASESAKTITHDLLYCTVDIFQINRETYQHARDEMIFFLNRQGSKDCFGWLLPLINQEIS